MPAPHRHSLTALLTTVCATAMLHATPTRAADAEQVARVFGPDFLIERIEAPVLERPREWIHRQPGTYDYEYVMGEGQGHEEEHDFEVPDPENERILFRRRIGDHLVETYSSEHMRDVILVEEINSEHGFRVVIEPGVPIPPGVAEGDEWEVEADLTAYDIESGEAAHSGRMEATHTYIGAWRISTPAGEFDTVLLHEDFDIHVGPLHVEDDRWVFLAHGIGLVAEKEAMRASALLLFHSDEDIAKVLTDYPEPPPAAR